MDQLPQTIEEPPLVTLGSRQEELESPVLLTKLSGPTALLHGGRVSPWGTKISKLEEFEVVGTRCKNCVTGY